MADAVEILLQQTLHGYADGHRLLAHSVNVRPRDAKAMLVMSDLPGPGARVPASGYLTGYPLPESGVYALARTWPAPEMPRPGCVWTHTLLVDYADLALMSNPCQLLTLFHRPGEKLDEYSEPVSFRDGGMADVSADTLEYAREVLYSLYEFSSRPVVGGVDTATTAERLVLALWAQQWPRLRRGFRFCTFTTTDRSADGAVFDLQFFPLSERGARGRFVGVVDASVVEPAQARWVEHALRDLGSPTESGLRGFLRHTAAEISTGREAFKELSELHALLVEGLSRTEAIDEAISLTVAGNLRTQRVLLAVASAALHATSLSSSAAKFVLEHLDALASSAASQEGARLARALWEQSPALFAELLAGSGAAAQATGELVGKLAHEEIMRGLTTTPEIASAIVNCRHDIVSKESFWRLGPMVDAVGLTHLTRYDSEVEPSLDAMMAASRGDLAPIVLRKFGVTRVAARVAQHVDGRQSEDVPAGMDGWVAVLTRDPGTLATLLGRGAFNTRQGLVALARKTQPDTVPNEYGEDPWWVSLRRATGEASASGEIFLASFLLARALGYRSRNQAELIVSVFDVVYEAAATPEMPEEAWRLLVGQMPWRYGLPEWERCPRLRQAVVDAFIDRELSPNRFVELTKKDVLFGELLELAADSWRGRRYLKRVRKELADSEARGSQRRVGMIEAVLDWDW